MHTYGRCEQCGGRLGRRHPFREDTETYLIFERFGGRGYSSRAPNIRLNPCALPFISNMTQPAQGQGPPTMPKSEEISPMSGPEPEPETTTAIAEGDENIDSDKDVQVRSVPWQGRHSLRGSGARLHPLTLIRIALLSGTGST
jgi:hypothetical protein